MKYAGFIFAVVLSLPLLTSAGLVPCGNADQKPCTFQDFYNLGNNVVNFITNIVVIPLATLSIGVAGYYYMLGGEKGVGTAKEILKYTLGGIALSFGAYLLVNYGLQLIGVSKEFNPLDKR